MSETLVFPDLITGRAGRTRGRSGRAGRSKDVLCQAVVGMCGEVSEFIIRWVAA